MDTYKLKIKIGDAEFDAEGPVETVQAQFAAFKELIEKRVPNSEDASVKPERSNSVIATMPAVERIMKVEGRVVSLTAHTTSLEDAVMLILVGQKSFRKNDNITGGEIIDGLRQSGHAVPRVDRVLDKLADEGRVIKIGERKATRYRLTNQGAVKGLEIAKEVISSLP